MMHQITLEPKHMMYWNRKIQEQRQALESLEPKHMMYWNVVKRNAAIMADTWTKTYDVLKWVFEYK